MGQIYIFFYPASRMFLPPKRKTIDSIIFYVRLIRCIFLLTFLLGYNFAFAQHYYAANGSGEMELLNDSTYIISFYGYNGIDYYDTGYYFCNNDNVIITSWKHNWSTIMDEFDTTTCCPSNDDLYVIRKYRCISGQYQLMNEKIVNKVYAVDDYDVISLGIDRWFPEDIIIVYDNNNVWRRCSIGKNIDCGELFIKLIPSKKESPGRIYLNHFCLQKKGNQLVPMSGTQQFDCWVINGFVFPKMQKKRRVLHKSFFGYRGQYGIERVQQVYCDESSATF